MHKLSEKYYKIIQNSDYVVESAVQVGSIEPVQVCVDIPGTVYGIDVLDSLSCNRALLGREAPSVGNFVSSSLEFSMLMPQEQIPESARIVPFSRVVCGEEKSEWVPKGVFWIDTRRKTRANIRDITIKISCYDAALKAEADFDTAKVPAWPASDITVLQSAAEQIGVGINEETSATISKGYSMNSAEDMSCREVICYIGAMYGGNFTIDDFGNLKLVKMQRPGTDPEKMICATPKAGVLSDGYSKVVLHVGNGTRYEAGDDSGKKLSAEIPWATQEMADNLLSEISGYQYQSYQTRQARNRPDIELGDYIDVGGISELLYSEETDYRWYISALEAPEENEINHEYPYVSSTARSAGRGISSLKKSVEDLTEDFDMFGVALTNVSANLETYVKETDEEFLAIAQTYAVAADVESDLTLISQKTGEIEAASAKLSTRVGDAESSLTLQAEKIADNEWAIATLDADVVNLKGLTEVDGSLNVYGGNIYSKHDIEALTGTVVAKTIAASQNFLIGGVEYTPQEITSTSGTVRVLGIA